MTKLSEKKSGFSTRRMVMIALFVALSYAVSLFEIPIFPATPYLKLDFGNVFVLLTGFLFGPAGGIAVCVLKEMLCLIGTTSGGVGQVANVLMTVAYIIIPSVVYTRRKGITTVLITLGIGCAVGTAVSLLANRFIIFPMYMGDGAKAVFRDVFAYVAAFNIIKTVSVSIVVLLVYKRLSVFIKNSVFAVKK